MRSLNTFISYLKRIFSLIIFIGICLLSYSLIIRYLENHGSFTYALIGFWVITSYIVLPRIHKLFASIYIPKYYIGRARTGDGLLGDPINLAINGTEKKLRKSMKKSGWILADDLNSKSSMKMTYATLVGKSYPSAPVSSLYMFNKKQDFAYQKETDGNTEKRHHVRFWKVPPGWKLPGGYQVDWLAAGTYDKSVGFSLFTLQITHKISENIDEEREYIIQTLKKSNSILKMEIVNDYSSGYHDRNGGGDRIKTDGSMPFITLK